MDLLILLGTLFFCFGIGMPISYALGLGALVGALWIGIPAEAVMLKISDGVSKVAMLTIPFFVLAGAIMAEGGMAHRLVTLCQRDRRSCACPRRPVRGEHSGDDVPQRHLRLLGRRYLGDRLGHDPANGKGRLSARLRHQRHDQRVGPGHHGAAEPQRGDLFAGDRRHHLDHQPVHGRRGAGPDARYRAGRAMHLHRLPRRSSERRRRAVARRDQDHHRCELGPDHDRHHHRRHSARHLHRDRSGRGRLHLGVLRDDVHLSRLPLARPAGPGASHAQDGGDGDDAHRDGVVFRLRDGADADADARSRHFSSRCPTTNTSS